MNADFEAVLRTVRQARAERPDELWILDAYSGAGGAGEGYRRAGWNVVGIDIDPQPRYKPGLFLQGDALDYLARREFVRLFHAAHTSPPCQRYSRMSVCRPGLAESYPDLVEPTRVLLQASGIPYVIENVPGAPLVDPITLCGIMFRRELYRHRLFEAGGFPLPQPEHPAHTIPGSAAGHWKMGTIISVSGNCAPVWKARQEMDIDWTNRRELGEAIPPYYTEYVGHMLADWLKR